MNGEQRVSSPWNASAVPVGAAMFLVAQFVMFALFATPQVALTLVAGWFVVAFVVQFWGSRTDRVVALVGLVLMALAVYLLVLLGG
ncbi:hypothetical protein GCM10009718_17560 [Isoptericola halotolerans]|uniref:Uncharacterized protein n=1 Tax=Isoptericola halotolerans TaxID=300560 RepID=A0ABX2A9L2_9MICO|nr:hypothetical protein [Isoptericola halotolerans]NOV98657.1 hypothetical protein [Isoptericola halotolerans]